MKIYITNVGSGKTLNFPIGNKKYDGIIGIVQKSNEFGNKYPKSDIEQDKLFNLIYENSNFKVKELIYLEANDSILNIGIKIISKLNEIEQKTDEKIKYHIETSQSYKKLGQILIILSQIISEKIDKLTFTRHDGNFDLMPLIGLKLSKNQFEVLKNYYNGSKNSNWNGKISRNSYVLNYDGFRNYLYRIIHELKNMGLINRDNNRVTDFGRLILKTR